MELNIPVNERTLRLIYDALLPEYEAAEQQYEDAKARFENVRDSMAKVKAALYPPKIIEAAVLGEDGTHLYMTHLNDETGEYDCSCPSFQYRRGLVGGHCKHIRLAILRGQYARA